MAHLIVQIDGVVPGGDDEVQVSGKAFTSEAPHDLVQWYILANYNALAATINQACIAAAIAAVETELEVSIGALDKKTLFGGAVGL